MFFFKDMVSQWAWISLTQLDWDGGMGEEAESLRGVLVSASYVQGLQTHTITPTF